MSRTLDEAQSELNTANKLAQELRKEVSILRKEAEDKYRISQGRTNFYCEGDLSNNDINPELQDHLELRHTLSNRGDGLLMANVKIGGVMRQMGLYLSPASLLRLSKESFSLYKKAINGCENPDCHVVNCKDCS